MKTSHNISTTASIPNLSARVRSVLTIAGIVTAIICSLVLLQDTPSAEHVESKAPKSIETSKVLNAALLVKLKDIATASTMGLFR